MTKVRLLLLTRSPTRRVGLAQPVERNGEHDDGEARLEPAPDVEPPQRGEDVIAKPASADHRGDDHHVEREHDDLIDAHEKLRPRGGKHDFEQHLPPRGAGHGAVLDDLVRHGLERGHRHANHGRHGIDHGRDQRRHRPEAEQKQDRDEIGEDRHRLHEIEDRLHDPPCDRNAIAENAEQHSSGHAERHRDRDRGERRHGARPLPEHREVQKCAPRQQSETRPPEAIAERRRDPDHGNPRQWRRKLYGCRPASAKQSRREDRGRRRERHVEEGADRARRLPEGEQAEGCVFHQPLHEIGDCLVQSKPPLAAEPPAASPESCRPAGRRKRPRARQSRSRRRAWPRL